MQYSTIARTGGSAGPILANNNDLLAFFDDRLSLSANIGNIASQLNTPLSTILGFAELLRSEALGPLGDYKTYANVIHENGIQLSSTIEKVALLAQAEAGLIKPSCKDQPMEDMVRKAVKLTARANADPVQIVPPAHRLTFHGDPELLVMCVAELLDNAIEASPRSRPVSVFWRRLPDGGAAIIVKDCGFGIPECWRSEIRRPFVKRQVGQAFGESNAGLGLSVAIRLAQLLDAELAIRSTDGEGTTCHLTLPGSAVFECRS